MSEERYENLRLPRDFLYLDHPFIYHGVMSGGRLEPKSDYMLTLDPGAEGDERHPPGWKVIKGTFDNARDIFYGTLDRCVTFVQMVTNDNPKLSFAYEETKPRSAVWHDR